MSESISQAITKFGNEATEQQLAKIVGFTPDELQMLNIFWEPAFNKSWIYLSPTMITKDMGYSEVSKFYRDTLRKQYKENIDYKETDENDALVKLFENSKWRSISIYKKSHKRGKKQKYYLVSGRALKKMLMRCRTKKSDLICEYYLKVEELASMMKDYILEISKRQIEEQKKQLNHAQIINKELLSYKILIEKKEILYVMSNENFARQGLFKVGKTKGKSAKRLSSLNTANPAGEDLVVLHEIKTHNAHALEKRCHFILQHLRPTKNREFFMCIYADLIKILEFIEQNMDKEVSEVNQMVKNVFNNTNNEWTCGLDLSIFQAKRLTITLQNEEKTTTVNLDGLSDDEKIAKAKEIIIDFIKNKKNVPDFDYTKEYEQPIIIPWKAGISDYMIQIYGKYNKLAWRKKIKNIADEQTTIKYKFK